ncbi:MAG: hypothetical protein IJ809_07600 [Clostridia bacterium]|nr:hypothetical protein [Clostridia bacterium]
MIKANYGFVAHRGMHSLKQSLPENSLGAFKLAMQNRFAIHFEVQLTFDNEAIVFGDADFKRLCSLDMQPSDCYLEEATRLMLNGTQYKVLSLKQALEAINGEVPILIEVLDEGTGNEIGILEEKIILALKEYHGVFAIMSKNPMVTLWFKNHYPNIERGQVVNETEADGVSSFLKRTLLKTQALNFVSSPNFIVYNIDDLKEGYAMECRKKNLPILGYTARTEEQLKKAKELCDGIIFEEIAVT